MEQFGVMIYEPSEEKRKAFHKLLVAYAVSSNVEILIRWVKPKAEEKAVSSASVEAQIAFVNTADLEYACLVGRAIYHGNPHCALVYYNFNTLGSAGELVKYFSDLFPSRPVMYLDQPADMAIYTTVKTVFEQEMKQKRFEWDTKNIKYRIPYSNISYFRSDRNNVYIHLENGTEYSIYGKLAQIATSLPPDCFVRIHQSYLVNKDTIVSIDKTEKTAHLRNGETLFISRAHYKEALQC